MSRYRTGFEDMQGYLSQDCFRGIALRSTPGGPWEMIAGDPITMQRSARPISAHLRGWLGTVAVTVSPGSSKFFPGPIKPWPHCQPNRHPEEPTCPLSTLNPRPAT